jgi:hypothetical protein
MRFVGAPDAIFTLTVVIGENLGHFEDTARHILTDSALLNITMPFCPSTRLMRSAMDGPPSALNVLGSKTA